MGVFTAVPWRWSDSIGQHAIERQRERGGQKREKERKGEMNNGKTR